jgi:hypothetical protein
MNGAPFLTRQLLEAPRPGIKTAPLAVRMAKRMRAALQAVDRDIEMQGSVSCATVEVCRATLALPTSNWR